VCRDAAMHHQANRSRAREISPTAFLLVSLEASFGRTMSCGPLASVSMLLLSLVICLFTLRDVQICERARSAGLTLWAGSSVDIGPSWI